MATFDLGRVTPIYRREYSATASYELNDVVLYEGNLYWHVQATATVGIAPTNTTVWKLAFSDEGVREEIRGYADDAQASADSALASKSAAAQSASQASASASQAALSAQAAQSAETGATASAQTASTKASEAAVSAQSAASSAQSATDKATLATNKAQAASESATLATAKANAAATSETNAITAANTATTKASEAAASATSAQEYDESAQQSAVNAQTAQGLAETAQTGAETAQGLAEDARDEAQEIVDGISAKESQIDANTASIVTLEEDCYKPYATDTASGSIVSFMDGADDIPLKNLVVDINPVQDLHGYDSPWPAGGGKNKIPYPYYSQAGTFDGVTYTIGDDGKITATGITESGTNFFFVRSMALKAGTYTASIIGDFAGPTFMIYDSVNRVAICNILPAESTHYKTFTIESDTTVNIYLNTSQTGLTFNISAYFQLEQGSTATAYAPYENICPISGWTGANVSRTAKNLLDPSLLKDQSAWNTIPIYAPAGTVLTMSNNQPTADTSGLLTHFRIPDGTQGSSTVVYVGHPVTQTVGEEGYLEVVQRNRDSITSYADYEYQIEVGSTATNYEPYSGQTIPIDWQTEAGTVYGGKLDVLSGVLTVDRAIVDLGTLTWTYFADKSLFMATISDMVNPDNTVIGKVTCEGYKTYSYNSLYADTSITGIAGRAKTATKGIAVRDTRFGSDTTAFKSAVSGIMTTYPLETPIEIQLTPHGVNSLLGTNNIFADTGDCSVEYRADTKLYIERLTEPDADMIADANIVSGQYFMVGNKLYKATANIASGSAVIVGTNAIRKSLSEALNEINS